LEHLFFRAPEVPLTLILTRRPNESACVLFESASNCLHHHFNYIHLEGLENIYSATLLQYFEPAELTRDDILDFSAGNPLFIEEYSKSAEQHGRNVPTRIQRTVDRRIAEMSRRARLVAQSICL